MRRTMFGMWGLVPYGVCLLRRRPAGRLRYHLLPPPAPIPPPWLEVQIPAAGVSAAAAAEWCRRQTLRELVVVGLHGEDEEAEAREPAWCVGAGGLVEERGLAPWLLCAPRLPDVPPSYLESTLLVAATEAVDGVLNLEGCRPLGKSELDGLGDESEERLLETLDEPVPERLQPCLVMRRDVADSLDGTGRHSAGGKGLLLKCIGAHGVAPLYEARSAYGLKRRGPYLSSRALGPELSVGIRDPSRLLDGTQLRGDQGVPLLVLTSFLATGGAEHTLYETLRALRDRFDLTLVTLAPHRAERGDRRADFRALSDRLYCLGDLVHPAAMVGILLHLVDRFGIRHVYNANGTTLFYEFAPQIKAARPHLRIVDHLYDHRVGYIDRYTPELRISVDACVAENHRIAEVLVDERGWESERVPVIWPCGRREDELPHGEREAESRRRARELFGAEEGDLVLLTAARMHPQKRPLDLVALAQRVRDLGDVRFVLVGGGDLESEVDAAIEATHGAPIRRLPFRSDIPELIAGADVGCLVSDYEGLPVFMIECLQMGRPFLGTAVGEMGRVLRETGAGIVVEEPGNLDGLEAAVRRLRDPSERGDLAALARLAAQRFDVASCADAYARAFLGDR